jgi:hypothetical protein
MIASHAAWPWACCVAHGMLQGVSREASRVTCRMALVVSMMSSFMFFQVLYGVCMVHKRNICWVDLVTILTWYCGHADQQIWINLVQLKY